MNIFLQALRAFEIVRSGLSRLVFSGQGDVALRSGMTPKRTYPTSPASLSVPATLGPTFTELSRRLRWLGICSFLFR